MEIVSVLWTDGLFRPMLNFLMFLYTLLFHNFGLAILAFTAMVRLAMFPLTIKQLKATKAMTSMQPKIEEVKRRYADDRQRMNQEVMKVYKEQGLNPLGCLGPFVIQFPIWIGLYQAIIGAIPAAPEGLVELSQHLYSWLPGVDTLIPINNEFLWMRLEIPDPTPVMPVLVGASTWVMQKMTTMPTADPKQQSTNTLMLWFFPAMLAFWTFSFPSGLAVYWMASNSIGVLIQYFITGWGGLQGLFPSGQTLAGPEASPITANPQPDKEKVDHGESGDNREDGRGGDNRRPRKAGRRAGRGRSRRH